MKKNNRLVKVLVILFFAIKIISCGDAQKKEVLETKESHTEKEDHHHDGDENKVYLTEEQMKLVGVSLGKIEMRQLSNVIKVNGSLDVPPQNLVSVSPLMGGFLKSTELLEGMKVKKGQPIAIMQNPEYITMQQNYMDQKSQLEYLEAEYTRLQELEKENIISKKELLKGKTSCQSMRARVSGLASQLNLLGINTAQLENNNYQNTISINAPINGYVTHAKVTIGAFVDTKDVLFKIVDTEHLHAELTVFEKDIPQIKIGQKVRFTLANENKERKASVYLIGREIREDRTVLVHCHLDKEDTELLPGMYLKAFVEAGTESVAALPNHSFVDFEGKSYVFVAAPSPENGKHQFKMIVVNKGIASQDYTEVKLSSEINNESIIVLDGAYDILAKIKNSDDGGGCLD